MSADNWEVCPRCLHEAGEGADREQHRTLREDYEWYGADKGVIEGAYSCACRVCGLTASASVRRQFWSPPS